MEIWPRWQAHPSCFPNLVSTKSHPGHTIPPLPRLRTFHDGRDAGGQAEAAEAVVEDLVGLEGGRGAVGDLDAGRHAVEDEVPAQDRVRVVGDEDARLHVPEDLVLLQNTCRGVRG